MRTRLLQTAALLLLIAALAACRERESRPTPTPEILSAATEAGATHPAAATSAASATVTLTPRPTHTPRPTATPTITPTPTATAPPILSRGDPLSYALQAPSPQGGAPCGVIDRLDFPLDPPDALDISRGGQDFGRFRSRYDGYHAGEDWWGPGGRGGSFGEAVYAIGHGQVTFAHPYGWGIDQGTIILRHVYADGREFYSFYGHLDPPSVELSYGACVRRGEKIGEIGRPRGSPHLHFEMRLHTPGDPGPGYWSHDPRRSGWLAPSQTIWEQRIGASPGVIWLRPTSNPGLQGIGLWQEQTLVAISGPDLLGLDVGEGSTRWRQPLMEVEEAEDDDDDERLAPIAGGVFDAREPIVYTADRRGRIIAVRLPSFAGGTEEQTRGANGDPQLLWDLQLHGVRGSPDLIPLPSGGVVLAVRQRMIAFSANGAILWRGSFEAQPVDWLALADRVLVSARGAEAGVWELSAEGRQAWNVEVSGILLQSGEHFFLYDARAVYRLDPATREATVFYDLADGLASESDAIALPDGGLLLAHMDSGNRRLMALDAQGALRWERSYGEQVDGRPTLLAHGEQVFLLSEEGSGSWSRVFLHRIDPQGAEMTLLFSGGTREAIAGGVWAYSNGSGSFLLNIGGGSLVALDVPAALRVVCNEQAAPAC